MLTFELAGIDSFRNLPANKQQPPTPSSPSPASMTASNASTKKFRISTRVSDSTRVSTLPSKPTTTSSSRAATRSVYTKRPRRCAAISTTVEEGVLDLGNLTAIRDYCKQLASRSDVSEIAMLVCNGALQLPREETTHDGLEITFGMNHLGHFLLATLLRERARRIVIISSETHDPAERAPVQHPNASDLEKLALGYEPFNPAALQEHA